MTFLQKLQAHEGGLVRLNISDRWRGGERLVGGRIGMVYSADPVFDVNGALVKVCLFIDEKVHTVFLYEKEVQFLQEPG